MDVRTLECEIAGGQGISKDPPTGYLFVPKRKRPSTQYRGSPGDPAARCTEEVRSTLSCPCQMFGLKPPEVLQKDPRGGAFCQTAGLNASKMSMSSKEKNKNVWRTHP